ncbi:phospholipase A-2-activating protein-like [Amphiura filiformis]|uniref:phospholipase A-2-activating protein-like n=1 Tax=Amphiura filiformis TaxID=82378 RepID=UPI003B213B83
MYRMSLQSYSKHGSSDEKEKKVIVPSNPYFPATDFVEMRTTKDKTGKSTMDKLKQFNSELQGSSCHSDKEISMLGGLLNATISTSSCTSPTTEQVQILHSILTKWPEDKLLPALDIFRLAVAHPFVNEYLCNSDSCDAMIEEVIKRVMENDNISVQMLLCRGICNSFIQPHGLEFLSNPKTRNSIIDAVLKLKDIEEGSTPMPNQKRVGLRIAATTLFRNFAVALHAKQQHDWHLVNAIADMLEKENDTGSNFRLLVALGTLMVDDYEAVLIARNRKVLEHLTKFLGREGATDKVGDCAYFLSKLMRDTA